MSRRRRAEKRVLPPDPRYGSMELARFVNRMMMRGKKTTIQRIVYQAFERVEEEIKQNPMAVFSQALKNVTPLLEVKPRRVGGATYQIPLEVPMDRGQSLGMKWLIDAARARKGMALKDKLAQELMDAFKGEGAAVKRREDLHRMAEANRAFVHYRW